jgi:hypothetical protein
MVKSL